jgi:hypothetical protein
VVAAFGAVAGEVVPALADWTLAQGEADRAARESGGGTGMR